MMATNEGNIHFDAQTLVVCNDCGGHDDVINYCLKCPGNICSKCKPTHSNRKLTKSHIVLHHADSEAIKARRSTKTYCSLHSGKECKTYCMSCRLQSCSVCVKAHKGHLMADLDDLILKTEHEVNVMVRDLETELIPNTEMALSKLEAEMTSYQETMNNVKISAKDRLKKLRQQLDKLEATFFAEVDKQAKDDLNTMQEQKNEIRKNVEKTKSAMEKGKTAPLDLGLVSIKHELAKICAQKPTEISYSQHFYFHESSYRFPSPFDVIGSVNKSQEKIIRNSSLRLPVSNGHKETFDYTREFKILHRIGGNQGKFVLNTIDDHVWVYDDNEKRISVYEGSLTKINAVYIGSKSVPSGFSCVDFVRFGLHDTLLTDSRNDRLLRITDSGSMTKFCVTSPFKPFGICVNDERQVVVGGRVGVDDLLKPWKIVIFSPEGSVMQMVEKDESGKRMFAGRISRVRQTQSKDYVVADGSRILYLSSEWILKWTQTFGTKYEVFALHCDKRNNILVGDVSKNAIVMLNQYGQQIQTILTHVNGVCKPLSMNVDSRGRLWIGQEKNVLISSYMEL